MDCLVTKLKGTVNDDSLMKLGELRVRIAKQSSWGELSHSITLNFLEPTKLTIIGDGHFTDKAGTADLGKEVTSNTSLTTYYVSNDDVTISIANKYALNYFSMYTNGLSGGAGEKYIVGEINALAYSKDITTIDCGIKTIGGDITSLKNLTKLAQLKISDSQVYGDLNFIKELPITILRMSDKITGELSSIPSAIVELFLNGNITGSLGDIESTNLAVFYSLNSNITGDLSDLSNKPLKNLTLQNNGNITGSLVSLKNIRTLTSIDLYKTTLISGNISDIPDSLTELSLANTQVTGSIDTIKAPLTKLSISAGMNITGTIEAFVATQRSNGRNTGSLSKKSWDSWCNIKFNDATPEADTITWTASQITCGDTTISV